MQNKPLAVAIIGFGERGRKVYQAVANAPSMQLVAICNRSPITATDDVMQKIPYFSSYDELLANNLDLDFVILTTPHIIHPEIIEEAAAAKKIHILKEKPFALSSAEANRYVALRKQHTVIINTLPPLMFADKVQFLAEQLPSIGAALSITIEYNMYIEDPFQGWRGSVQTSGGGCISDQGYHMAHLLISLLGTPCEVSAMMGFVQSSTGLCDDPTEHIANIQFRYQNGAFGTISLSRCHGPKTEKITILGSQGILEMHNNRVALKDRSGVILLERDFAGDQSYKLIERQIEYFAQLITQDIEDTKILSDNLDTVQFIESAYQSAQQRFLKFNRPAA